MENADALKKQIFTPRNKKGDSKSRLFKLNTTNHCTVTVTESVNDTQTPLASLTL